MAVDAKDLAIHDEIVVETEIDGAFVGLPSFITNVLAEELWLAMRLPDPRLQGLEEGQPIHLAFERGSLLIVESTFLRRLGGNTKRLGMEKSRVFAVRRPQGLEGAQRRAHVRVDLERTVRIRSLTGMGGEQMGTGKTVNIGAGGIQFRTEMPLVMGEQLRIALVLTSRDIVIAGGPIVRIEDHVDPAADLVPGGQVPAVTSRVAVRFDKITDIDQERIACHILSAHRKRSSEMPTGLPVVERLAMLDEPQARPDETGASDPEPGDSTGEPA
jgi:c-di-GMP-binding flagellar brake protein YcgR